MKQELKDRLNQILPRIESDAFLQGQGLGNEIGFYVFDYPPEEELEVRRHVAVILDHLAKKRPELSAANVNLFRLIVDYLKDRGLLDQALVMQREKGDEALRKALKAPLREDRIAEAFVEVVRPAERSVIFLSGVGNAWPLVRSHTLLNNLQSRVGKTPLVMFYPGVYDGQGLRLFGRLTDDNYYRAFRLIG